MGRLTSATRPPAAALVLLVVAALPFAVAGFDHARLYHRGYAETGVVGTLFLLNGIATGLSLLLLAAGRARLFVLAVLAISVPSVAGIALSHSGIGFLRFREGEWDTDALLIVGCEIAATLLALAAVALGALRDTRPEGSAAPGRPGVSALVAAAVVVVVFAAGAIGIGVEQGEARQLTDAQVASSARAIQAGGPEVAEGRRLFAKEGCSKCHAIAAAGYGGALGPQLDAEEADEEAEEFLEEIVARDEESLMRMDYDERLSSAEARALAAFVAAAAVGEGD